MEDKLRLNLQFFSEDNADDSVVDTPEVDEVEATDDVETKESDKAEKTYTQEDIDRIVKDRLAREKKKADEAAEKARLEEQGQYKELLDKANDRIAELENEKLAAERSKAISDKLLAKGIKSDEVSKYAKYVEKLVTTDEDVDGAVDEVYNDFVAAQQDRIVEPSAGFGDGKNTTKQDPTDFGRELFKRVKR